MRGLAMVFLLLTSCAELVMQQEQDPGAGSSGQSLSNSALSSLEQSSSSATLSSSGQSVVSLDSSSSISMVWISSSSVQSSSEQGVSSSFSSVSSVSSTPAPFLQYWNTLGSADELSTPREGYFGVSWGSEVQFVQGVFGGAISNDRPGYSGARATLPPAVFLMSTFTCEFWIKNDVEATNISTSVGSILSMVNNDKVIHLQHSRGLNGEFLTRFQLAAGGESISYVIEHGSLQGCAEFLPPGVWVHLACISYSAGQPGRRMMLYRNGVEQTMHVESDGVIPEETANFNITLLSSCNLNDQGFDTAIKGH